MSIDDRACHLCIGCSLSLINKGTKLYIITDIFGTSLVLYWYFTTGDKLPSPGKLLARSDFARSLCAHHEHESPVQDSPSFPIFWSIPHVTANTEKSVNSETKLTAILPGK